MEYTQLQSLFRLIRLDNVNESKALAWKEQYLAQLACGNADNIHELLNLVAHEMYLNNDDSARTQRGIDRLLTMFSDVKMSNSDRTRLLLKAAPICNAEILATHFSPGSHFAVDSQELNMDATAPAPVFYYAFLIGNHLIQSEGIHFMAKALEQWDDFSYKTVERIGFMKSAAVVEALMDNAELMKVLKRTPLIFNDEALSSPGIIEFALTEDKFGLSQQSTILKYLVNNQHEELALKAVDAFGIQIARNRESDGLKKGMVGSLRLSLRLNVPHTELWAKIDGLLEEKEKAFAAKYDVTPSI